MFKKAMEYSLFIYFWGFVLIFAYCLVFFSVSIGFLFLQLIGLAKKRPIEFILSLIIGIVVVFTFIIFYFF